MSRANAQYDIKTNTYDAENWQFNKPALRELV